jgi:hypothetical protein
MFDGSTAGQPAAAHHAAPADEPEDGTPLREFAWSDRVVGIGYFPEEVALPSGWTWPADAVG